MRGVALAQGLAGLTPGPALHTIDKPIKPSVRFAWTRLLIKVLHRFKSFG